MKKQPKTTDKVKTTQLPNLIHCISCTWNLSCSPLKGKKYNKTFRDGVNQKKAGVNVGSIFLVTTTENCKKKDIW